MNINASATDPDGDPVTLEYSGNTSDSCYAVGTHTVKVRARDAWGLTSDWTDITFTVVNSAPTTPVITRTPDGNSVAPGTAITITASSTDPDGDAITYVWEGRPAQTSTGYPLGKNVVRVKAVDSTGAESPWTAIVFFVSDATHGGGMKGSIFSRNKPAPPQEEAEPDVRMLAVWGSPGSGKTTVSVRLAKYLADHKRDVALLLCDMF